MYNNLIYHIIDDCVCEYWRTECLVYGRIPQKSLFTISTSYPRPHLILHIVRRLFQKTNFLFYPEILGGFPRLDLFLCIPPFLIALSDYSCKLQTIMLANILLVSYIHILSCNKLYMKGLYI